MKGWGVGLMIAGPIIAMLSLLLDTTVTTSMPSVAGYLTTSTEVHNLGLLQQQMFAFVAGAAIFTAGSALFGAGTVVELLRGAASVTPGASSPPVSVAPAPPPPVPDPVESPEELAARQRDEDRVMYTVLAWIGGVIIVATLIAYLAGSLP